MISSELNVLALIVRGEYMAGGHHVCCMKNTQVCNPGMLLSCMGNINQHVTPENFKSSSIQTLSSVHECSEGGSHRLENVLG